ncbi:MAG: trimethylamine methyltransferase family protein, partial [Thermoleophilia bacterium]
MRETPTHSFGSSGPLVVLPLGSVKRLDAAALEVLEEVGVSVPSAPARAALAAKGAKVDGPLVRLAPEVVRRLVALAPRRLTLGARCAAPLVTGTRSLATTDGCCVEIYDLESGLKRGTTAADVATIA